MLTAGLIASYGI